jgi:hypothetical protein
MATIVIGVDGGLTVGGCVALNVNEASVCGFEWWCARNENEGRYLVSEAVKRLAVSIPYESTYNILVAEGVYMKTHIRRIKSEEELNKVMSAKGFVDVTGPGNRTPITVSQSVGVFLFLWPKPYVELTSSEWRKIVGIPVGKGIPYKEWAIRKAQEHIKSLGGQAEALRVNIVKGNDHLAEAYLIALAGLEVAIRKGFAGNATNSLLHRSFAGVPRGEGSERERE